jgi:hypothetical protein
MPSRYPDPISKQDKLFWDALKAFDGAQDISASEEQRDAAKAVWKGLCEQLERDDFDLITKRRRSPVGDSEPEVKTWVPMELAQCPYCRAWTNCSRISPLPRRCPNCFMLIDRREVKP